MSDKSRAIDVPSPAWQLNTGTETETVKPSGPSKEDKVALAMKLAEEARERAAAKAAEEQKKAERVALAKKLADEARARATAEKVKKAAPAPTKRKKMTAQEALAAAIAAEEDTQPAPAKAKKKATHKKRKKPATPTKASAKSAAHTTSDADPTATLLAALGDVNVVGAGTPVSNATVFAAVWTSHASRARHEGDLQMVALATLLVRSAKAGTILAWRIESNEAAWAVWTDESGHVLGAASPADIYLTGT